jgi:DNA-binding CsgD family transcriptional regulator
VRERSAIDRLLAGIRAGESGVLVIRGEAGIGKTALLQYCRQRATGCRVAEIAGIESEMELPLAALHQLCGPMLGELAALPEPQEHALKVAFGLSNGSTPDRFLVGLAVLSLLAEVSAKEPLVCLVDDAQWLDEPSSRVLGFVGRRLLAESVLLLLAVREPSDEPVLPSLPDLSIAGLTDQEARELLSAAIPGQLDEQVRDRIIAETRGNPLGLLELPRGMTPAELAGGFGVPPTTSVSGHLAEHYRQRVSALPPPTRRLMLLAAADATGDATLLWRAAHTLGVGRDAAAVADSEQLLEIGSRVRFRHPLVRSAAYAAASSEERSAAHLALAGATDQQEDPERRVWHLAAAATGFDEEVAAALERTAGRVEARAGLAAAASFLQRAVTLTAAPDRRADRALAAAQAHVHAGSFDAARSLLAEAAATSSNDLQRARVEQLNGQIEAAARPGREAPARLLQAAVRLESLDVRLARDTYLDAYGAANLAAHLAAPGGHLVDIARAARAAPRPPQALPCDLLLDGLAMMVIDGREAAAPTLRLAIDDFLNDRVAPGDWIHQGARAALAAFALWDFDNWEQLSTRHMEQARASGALGRLAVALNSQAILKTWCGDFDAAAALVAAQNAVTEATGTRMASYSPLLAAFQGRPPDPSLGVSVINGDLVERGNGLAAQIGEWATAVLGNALGRYHDAFDAAREAAHDSSGPSVAPFALSELIEAAVRIGSPETAADALRRLSALTVSDSDWATGVEARGRALVAERDEAEQWYTEAIQRLARTRLQTELARTRLLYGEWLRRENRRVDARRQLRLGHQAFVAMGADAFAERARRELVATGEKVRKRDVDTRFELTPQEEHIARLARDGHTNLEIGAELFISARTVEWHLRKVFTKLGITSRRDLRDVLPTRSR